MAGKKMYKRHSSASAGGPANDDDDDDGNDVEYSDDEASSAAEGDRSSLDEKSDYDMQTDQKRKRPTSRGHAVLKPKRIRCRANASESPDALLPPVRARRPIAAAAVAAAEEGADDGIDTGELAETPIARYEFFGLTDDGELLDPGNAHNGDSDDEGGGGDGHSHNGRPCLLCLHGHNDQNVNIRNIGAMISARSGLVSDAVLYREAGKVQLMIEDCIDGARRATSRGGGGGGSGGGEAASVHGRGASEAQVRDIFGDSDSDQERDQEAPSPQEMQRRRQAAALRASAKEVENHNRFHALTPEVICAENVRMLRKVVRMYSKRLVSRNVDLGTVEPSATNINGMLRVMHAMNDILKLQPKKLMFHAGTNGGK